MPFLTKLLTWLASAMSFNHKHKGKSSAASDAIEAGRQHYAAKRYKPALEQFTRAMKHCPCARDRKRERCSCKNYEQVASANGCLFNEAMYNCKCSVGQTFNKCDRSTHIQALDYRAATFEALDELDRARRDAEWILELAPRQPDGYLRLGKIARLQKKREFAWKIYNAGIKAGLESGINSPKMEQLYKAREPLQRRFIRRDPIHLPLELIQLIFSYVDLDSIVRCLQVCKTWKATLTARGNERLWRSLVFAGLSTPKRPPRTDGLRKLLAYSNNDVRELVIENAKKFGLTQMKFLALLSGAKNLQRLELSIPSEAINFPPSLKTVKHLVLRGFDHTDDVVNLGSNLFYKFMINVGENLESLHLLGVPMEWSNGAIPTMAKLRFLRLEKSRGQPYPVSIFHILDRTPALEQLCVDSVKIDHTLFEGCFHRSRCPNIKVLRIIERRSRNTVFDVGSSTDSTDAYRVLSSLNSGKTFQHLDISYHWDYSEQLPHVHEVLNPDAGYSPEKLLYENLEALRLRFLSISPVTAEQIFRPAAEAGKIHTFDLVFPHENLQGRVGLTSTTHLKAYDWLRGADSIRHLGIFRFSFSMLYFDVKEMPLLDFLASFPNLASLEIDSAYYEETDLFVLIRDIFRVTRLKTLYQCRVKGALMDQLKALAAKHGVELVWGERPRAWPVPLGQ